MLRRSLFILGLIPPLLAPHLAEAGWWDPDGAGVGPGIAGDDGVQPAPRGDDSSRTYSRRLGDGTWLSRGVHWAPYLEVEAHSWDSASLGWLEPSRSPSDGHFLIGGKASYLLAPRWSLSLDLAAGRALAGEPADRRHLAAPSPEGEDNDLAWRTGIKLGYALGADFSAFTQLQVGNLADGAEAALRLLQPGPAAPETSLRLGFAYRFR